MKSKLIPTLALMLFFSHQASAEQLVFRIQGTISNVYDSDNSLNGAIAEGDSHTTYFSYNLDTPDTTADPNQGNYPHFPTENINQLVIEINGNYFFSDPNSQYNVNVDNDRGPSNEGYIDQFDVNANGYFPGFKHESSSSIIHLNFQSPPNQLNMLLDDSLPVGFDVSFFDSGSTFVEISGYGYDYVSYTEYDYSVRGTVDTIDLISGSDTEEGNNVAVAPLVVDSSGNSLEISPIVLEFDNVTDGGSTDIVVDNAGPTPDHGFQLGEPATYYDITSTAQFENDVNVCVEYGQQQFIDESNLSLMHFEAGSWVDITTFVDSTRKKICGITSSFSPFVLMEPTPSVPTCNGYEATIVGTDDDDVLNGTPDVDVIVGLAGDDTINGFAGDDHICAGDGNDTVDGGSGKDFIDSGNDNDWVKGGADTDTIFGGDGDDTLRGSKGNDVVDGGRGIDTIDGGVGNDTIKGGPDNDIIYGNDGNDIIRGSKGDDRLDGGAGIDELNGGTGNDYLKGGQDNDTLIGGTGNDELRGSKGDDFLDGGEGNDSLNGGVHENNDECVYNIDDVLAMTQCEIFIESNT